MSWADRSRPKVNWQGAPYNGMVGPLAGLPTIGIGRASRPRPSHTTVHTDPYMAVRKVKLQAAGRAFRAAVSPAEP